MIELEEVSLSFGDVDVLDGVSLTVERGEFVALVGPNGAGKTTLLRTINGLLIPTAGTVRLDGRDVSSLSAREISRVVASVPQDTHVGFSFTASNLVEMGRTPHRSRLDWTEQTGPVEAAMRRTETWSLRDRTVDELSGGERQRVLLARALAQETTSLLLDEPTSNLDINHQIRVLGLVDSLVDEGKAALAAIHDLDLAARYCDRLVLLYGGGIIASGSPEQVLAEENLIQAFETDAAITQNPITGTPTVSAIETRPVRSGRVHVVGSGTGALRAIRVLWRNGYELTLGPVPEGDVASQFAVEIDVDAVTVPVFDAPDAGKCKSVAEQIGDADVVVVTHDLLEERGQVLEPSDGTPYVRADLGGSGPLAAHGDGGEAAVVSSESELVAAVSECFTRVRTGEDA